MSRSVYIATGLDNADNHQLMRAHLEQLDVGITYDWVRAGRVEQNASELRARAVVDMLGVGTADFVVALLPGSRQLFKSAMRGSHIEIGAAIMFAMANDRQVYLISPDPFEHLLDAGAACVFYYHPRVTRIVCTPENYAAAAAQIVSEVYSQ